MIRKLRVIGMERDPANEGVVWSDHDFRLIDLDGDTVSTALASEGKDWTFKPGKSDWIFQYNEYK